MTVTRLMSKPFRKLLHSLRKWRFVCQSYPRKAHPLSPQLRVAATVGAAMLSTSDAAIKDTATDFRHSRLIATPKQLGCADDRRSRLPRQAEARGRGSDLHPEQVCVRVRARRVS